MSSTTDDLSDCTIKLLVGQVKVITTIPNYKIQVKKRPVSKMFSLLLGLAPNTNHTYTSKKGLVGKAVKDVAPL